MSSVLDLSRTPHNDVIDTPFGPRTDGCGPYMMGAMNVPVRKCDTVSRTRCTYARDITRYICDSAAQAWAQLEEHAGDKWTFGARPSVDIETIKSMIETRGFVVCPWPREKNALQLHRSITNHYADLTIGFPKMVHYSDLFAMSKERVFDKDGSAPRTRTIEFKVSPEIMRRLVNEDNVSTKRWESKSSYHVLPVSIHTTNIDSSLPGFWQLAMITELPTERNELPAYVHQHSHGIAFSPSALIGPTVPNQSSSVETDNCGDQFLQKVRVRETQLGGTNEHQSFRQIRNSVYSCPDFNRWLYVDFVGLHTKLDVMVTSVQSQTATDADVQYRGTSPNPRFRSKEPALASNPHKGKTVYIPMYANWEAMYNDDSLSIPYIVLTELVALRELHKTLTERAVTKMSIPMPEMVPFPIDKDRMLVPYELIYMHLHNRRQQFNIEQYMMRLDTISFHLSPVNGDEGWAQLRSVCDAIVATKGADASCPTNRVRFAADITMIYEECTATIDEGNYTSSSAPRQQSTFARANLFTS